MTEIKRGRPVTLSTSGKERITLGKIRRDGGTQPRAGLDDAHVQRLVEALDEGLELPAVTLFFDGETYWLADGFHRFEAHQRKLIAEINADIRQGERRDAVLHSVGANRSHGLPRSRDDVRRAIETLLRDEEWGRWSDREIARQVGCDHKTVAAARERLSGEIPQIDNRTVSRNGTIYTQQPKQAVSPPNKPDRVCQECRGNNPYDFYPSRPETWCPGCYQLYTAKTHKALMLEVRQKLLLEAFQWHWERPGLMKQILDVADTFGIDLSQAETKWFPKLPNGFRWIRSGAGVVQVERLANGLHTRNLYLDALKDGVAWANEQATRPITWGHAPAVTLEQRVERIKTSNDPQSAVALELLALLISSRTMDADEGDEVGDEVGDEDEDDKYDEDHDKPQIASKGLSVYSSPQRKACSDCGETEPLGVMYTCRCEGCYHLYCCHSAVSKDYPYIISKAKSAITFFEQYPGTTGKRAQFAQEARTLLAQTEAISTAKQAATFDLNYWSTRASAVGANILAYGLDWLVVDARGIKTRHPNGNEAQVIAHITKLEADAQRNPQRMPVAAPEPTPNLEQYAVDIAHISSTLASVIERLQPNELKALYLVFVANDDIPDPDRDLREEMWEACRYLLGDADIAAVHWAATNE